MVNFEIRYVDGSLVSFENVKKAVYNYQDSKRSVEQENLSDYPFPVGRDIWLYSETGSLAVSGAGMRYIQTYLR